MGSSQSPPGCCVENELNRGDWSRHPGQRWTWPYGDTALAKASKDLASEDTDGMSQMSGGKSPEPHAGLGLRPLGKWRGGRRG